MKNDHMAVCNPSPARKLLVTTKQKLENRTNKDANTNQMGTTKYRSERKESTVTRRSVLRMKIHSKVEKETIKFKKRTPSIALARNPIRSKKEVKK
jgi:hypothetical protein